MAEDKELFKLCEQVYKATRWQGVVTKDNDGDLADMWFNSVGGWVIVTGVFVSALDDEPDDWVPLYSSDYLLEKLTELRYQIRVEHNHSDMKWYAYFAGKNLRRLFDEDGDWALGGSTPLKALLKLALKLKQEGLLNATTTRK